MATARPRVVSMELAIPCRPSSSVLLLHHVSPGLRTIERSAARLTTTILCSATPRPCVNVASIHALDPDFYNIPYVDGVPVGKRLKLWNLPPNCKHSELLEWFSGVNVVIESLELINDPALNAHGIGGFVEFATKQDACIAIVRLDGYKFRGHYIRMDFAERRPRPNYGSRRSRPNQNNSSRGSSMISSRMSARDMASSNVAMPSSIAQSTARYDASVSSIRASSELGSSPNMGPQSSSCSDQDVSASITSTIQASSDLGSIQKMGPQSSSPSSEGIQQHPAYGNAQCSPDYGTVLASTCDFVATNGHGSNSSNLSFSDSQVPTSSLNAKALTGPGNAAEAPNNVVAKQAMSGVEDKRPAGAVSGIGQTVPPSPYTSDGMLDHRNVDPSDDQFYGYGALEQAMVEPWSNKISFRSGPMYGSPKPPSFGRLLVGNMDMSVDDATLQQLFSKFGTVLEAKVLRDPESGRSRGLGIVAMSSAQEVKAAFEALDGWCVENRPLKVDAVAL
ncbi:hypothetical protein GOP47_0012908 [Adiantum capillus-veneris]|uniref:RRM domain-containing protein n=1 Tax=Adiantum capillus-veneris TaxID=13818 RepID=A0A9D4ZG52_ADICA|nr:hypothetical protein GOP47_0012908 [Adiantum capillus-veneris]